jgi:hypothetical protein
MKRAREEDGEDLPSAKEAHVAETPPRPPAQGIFDDLVPDNWRDTWNSRSTLTRPCCPLGC